MILLTYKMAKEVCLCIIIYLKMSIKDMKKI